MMINSSSVVVCVALVSLLGITACSKSQSGTANFAEFASGIWQSGCQNFGINSEYGQVELQVGESTFEFKNTFYEDPQCMRPTLRLTSDGVLTKHSRLRQEDSQAYAEIDFLIEQVSAEVLSVGKRSQFNGNATCALVNWEVGVNVDVSNCVDIAGSNVPRTEYDIYDTAKENHPSGVLTAVLYTGPMRGASEAERPTQLDFQNPYWRIGDAPTEE